MNVDDLFVYIYFIIYPLVFQIAAEVSAPLAKTDEIVLLGGGDSNITGELTRLVGQVPPAVHALTGVDLSKVNNMLMKR
jgi:hypothetical protein